MNGFDVIIGAAIVTFTAVILCLLIWCIRTLRYLANSYRDRRKR